eukprot:g1101.t1
MKFLVYFVLVVGLVFVVSKREEYSKSFLVFLEDNYCCIDDLEASSCQPPCGKRDIDGTAIYWMMEFSEFKVRVVVVNTFVLVVYLPLESENYKASLQVMKNISGVSSIMERGGILHYPDGVDKNTAKRPTLDKDTPIPPPESFKLRKDILKDEIRKASDDWSKLNFAHTQSYQMLPGKKYKYCENKRL